jgi:ABC-type nitrate/sulfonate/bicarbonate transport system permease component
LATFAAALDDAGAGLNVVENMYVCKKGLGELVGRVSNYSHKVKILFGCWVFVIIGSLTWYVSDLVEKMRRVWPVLKGHTKHLSGTSEP